MNPNYKQSNYYDQLIDQVYLPDEEYEQLSMTMSDDDLIKTVVRSLDQNKDYWNKNPWNLDTIDKDNISLYLGQKPVNPLFVVNDDDPGIDNRIFSSVRAVLSYVTAQLARPEITPSRGDDIFIKGARDLEAALYQHSLDEKADMKVRSAIQNLITRKRGYLKLRWDKNRGVNGDVITEVVDPSDIIIDRHAKYLGNPNVIYQRIRCSVDELISIFPEKRDQILNCFGIKQGRFTQRAMFVEYFEAWFTYYKDGLPKEGVCWFIPGDHALVLDKMPNPNWIYTGDDKKDKQTNILSAPPKPYVAFNYLNFGSSFIDETSLVEQAAPLQRMLNRRLKQIWENADYVNGRWIVSKAAFNEEDAYKLINKGPKTLALADAEDVNKAMANIATSPLPAWVENTLYDVRQEIDGIMGTPSQFKGSQPRSSDTLGRDLMIKEQAGMLQDDLVRAVDNGMETYYAIKLQLWRVNYTDDYWFQTKGGDGKYMFIMINGESLDRNVKVGVQTDSTLPLDKASIRNTAMELWKAGNAIDYRTLMEDLGLPNPEIRTERYLRQQLDPQGFLKSVELTQINDEAEADITLLIAGKAPEERDKYDQAYFDYFNDFITGNRFAKLTADDRPAAQRILAFIMAIQHVTNEQVGMKESILNAAGLTPTLQPEQPTIPGESGEVEPEAAPPPPAGPTAPPAQPPIGV